jgi:coenzyme F420-dependent glucose-6-phosphate dehydrogenase
MVAFGYKVSSEEHGPQDLVRYARMAEDAGFTFAAISDHFHPWIDKQGHSPFVWGVLGAIAQATDELKLITGVTCPTMRVHPAIVAHAVATTSLLMPGRFSFGVGSGENLNEHILGDHWPPAPVRLEMLQEAIEVMRELWSGTLTSHLGKHYTVENARLYDVPDEPPPVLVAASGKKSLTLAGEIGDGLIALAPDEGMIESFNEAGGSGKPKYCEVGVCWATSEDEAKRTVREWWPLTGLGGQLMQETATPALFEAATDPLSVDQVVETVSCGPDPDVHIENARKFIDAGYTHIWFHQIGPDQEGFFSFFEREVLPKLG